MEKKRIERETREQELKLEQLAILKEKQNKFFEKEIQREEENHKLQIEKEKEFKQKQEDFKKFNEDLNMKLQEEKEKKLILLEEREKIRNKVII